jgi:hypothetical protein
MPGWYDTEGRKIFRPGCRHESACKPTFPAGRFVSQALKHWCSDLAEQNLLPAKSALYRIGKNFLLRMVVKPIIRRGYCVQG